MSSNVQISLDSFKGEGGAILPMVKLTLPTTPTWAFMRIHPDLNVGQAKKVLNDLKRLSPDSTGNYSYEFPARPFDASPWGLKAVFTHDTRTRLTNGIQEALNLINPGA